MTATTSAPLSDHPSFAMPLRDQCLHAIVTHRMLTIDQLHRLLGSTKNQIYKRVADLARAGWVEAVGVKGVGNSTLKVWLPTAAGVDRALADPDLHRRHVPKPASHRSLVAHTLAVNEVGLAFVEEARRHEGHECDAFAWEHEVAHSLSSNRQTQRLIADAVLSYLMPAPGGGISLARRFIELDRGTEAVHILHDKLRRYARYKAYESSGRDGAAEPYWQQRYVTWPAVLVVVGANPAKSTDAMFRRISTVIQLLTADPLFAQHSVPVLMCHFDELVTHGPMKPIWWRPGSTVPVSFTGDES